MDILFATYQNAYQNPGGGEIQLLNTRDAVQEKSASTETFDPFESDIENADVLHVFSVHQDVLSLIRYANQVGTPVALTPIIWDQKEKFRREGGFDGWYKYFREYVNNFTTKLGHDFLDHRKEIFDRADVVMPNSQPEADIIANIFSVSEEKFSVLHNGVETEFADAEPATFVNEYGLSDFVLFVCYPDPVKNLDTALEALRDIDRPIVVIGPIDEDNDYAQKCVDVAGDNTHFLGSLPHHSELLKSAYAAAEVFALPSWYETTGLVALEAGLAGTKVAATNRGATGDYIGEHGWYFDPANPSEIREQILAAAAYDGDYRLREHLLNNFTWEDAAEEAIEGYRRLLK